MNDIHPEYLKIELAAASRLITQHGTDTEKAEWLDTVTAIEFAQRKIKFCNELLVSSKIDYALDRLTKMEIENDVLTGLVGVKRQVLHSEIKSLTNLNDILRRRVDELETELAVRDIEEDPDDPSIAEVFDLVQQAIAEHNAGLTRPIEELLEEINAETDVRALLDVLANPNNWSLQQNVPDKRPPYALWTILVDHVHGKHPADLIHQHLEDCYDEGDS